ncbi:MAG: VWA domain-containing protein [Pyrinomonadaceae bacterium]
MVSFGAQTFVAACIFVSGLAPLAAAQSGRNTVKPDPERSKGAVENTVGYSESRPAARARSIRPRAQISKANDDAPKVPRPPTSSDENVIRIDTELVTVPVSVLDKNGQYVSDLQQGDFTIFEDGVEQEIAYFGVSDKPFTVVLLLDTSLSTNYKIEEIRRAAIAFVGQLKSQDAVLVIEFDGNVNVLTNLTRDRPRIYKAIGKADFGYGTSLYDAVYYSLRKKLSKVEGRKAIVLFTDGVDTTSEDAGYDTTLSAAEEADVTVFPVYYNTIDWNKNSPDPIIVNQVGTSAKEYALGRRYLTELAEYTGGRVFVPDTTPNGLTAAFEGIAEELRRQYNIGYVPSASGSPGQRKEIRVRVDRPNLNVRARDSYIVGAARTLPPERP